MISFLKTLIKYLFLINKLNKKFLIIVNIYIYVIQLVFHKISITYIKIYLPLKIMINIPLLSKKKKSWPKTRRKS